MFLAGACHVTHYCCGLKQWKGQKWDIPIFELLVKLNSPISQCATNEKINSSEGAEHETTKKSNLPHLKTAHKNKCSQSPVWSECHVWALWSTEHKAGCTGSTNKSNWATLEYEYMWRVDSDRRAASQSSFEAQMAYAFLKTWRERGEGTWCAMFFAFN